jgi:cytochrome c5
MNRSTFIKALLALLSLGLLLRAIGPDRTTAFAQTPASRAEAAEAKAAPVDRYDRNATLWAHQRSGYTSGWQRGQEIYYMKCWMCHNEYVIAADHTPAPSLRDVAKRLTDDQITVFIRRGTARMPAYTSGQLSDADIKDLLSLFREKCGTLPTGGGCFDEHNPPPNPLYRFR